MAVSEEARHRLYQRLEEVLGHEHARTMMESIPPLGWSEVASKRDLDELAARMATKEDIATLRAEFRGEQNRLLLGVITANAAMAGLALAAAQLIA